MNRLLFILSLICLAAPAPPLSAASFDCDLSKGTRDGLVPDDRGRLGLEKAADGYRRHGEYLSQIVDLGQAGTATVSWLEQWTAPQRWKKHPGNPIFGPQQTGEWDDWTNGVAIVRNPGDKSYKMFYSGRKGAGIGFAEASIDDPLTWKENSASPVLRPRADNWEGNQINQPRVVKVTDDHWRMYYSGWGFQGDGGTSWTFGLAESFDRGVTWKRHGDQPLMDRGPKGSYDDGGVFVPEVRRVADGWMMWYTAHKVIAGRQSIHLCAATSDDGIAWKKYEKNPVVTDDFTTGPSRNVISRCHVRIDDGVFRMWYSHAKPDYRIRYAESLDGLDWERLPLHLALDAAGGTAWDSKMVEYPTIDVVNGRSNSSEWRIWFCGNGYGSVGFAEGIVETGIKLSLRSGTTKLPDAMWSKWESVARDKPLPTARYVQVKAELWSHNPQLSPALNRVTLSLDAN